MPEAVTMHWAGLAAMVVVVLSDAVEGMCVTKGQHLELQP